MTKDLTTGSPMKLILGFTIPMLFGYIFQQFYSMVDTIIVGKYLGVDALAAVGATGAIYFMIIGFCMGVCSGFAIPVAQRFGARDYSGVRRYIANSVWLSAVFAVVMTILTSVFCRQILMLMRTPENIMEDAYIYILIIFLGIPATYLYNLLSGVIRALGDSKTPLIFLVVSSFLNIGLDLLFIITFQMGVAGAALATIIAQGISGVLCLIYGAKRIELLRPHKDEWKIDGHRMKMLCGMGVPMGLQYSITAIGSVILQAAVNTLGSTAVAAVTAASKIGMFLVCPFDAMGATMATYGGQNVGAGKLKRIGEGLKSCVLLGAGYAVISLGIVLIFGRYLALLFVDAGETAIISQVYTYMWINAAFYFPLALVNIVRFLIQGIGFPKFAIIAGVFEMAARSVVGFAFVPIFGYTAACLGSPVAWVMADLFLVPAYFYCYGKLKKQK